MNLPRKLQKGDRFQEMYGLWNALLDYLRKTRLVAGHGISIQQLAAGTTLSVQHQPPGAVAGGSEDYSGMFRVVDNGDGTVSVIDGADEESEYCGIDETGRVPRFDAVAVPDGWSPLFLCATWSEMTQSLSYSIATEFVATPRILLAELCKSTTDGVTVIEITQSQRGQVYWGEHYYIYYPTEEA